MIHTLTGTRSNPHWPVPLAELSCSPPAPSPEAIKCGEPPSASLPHFLRVLFDGFLLFRLLPFFFLQWGGTERQGLSHKPFMSLSLNFWVCNWRYHCRCSSWKSLFIMWKKLKFLFFFFWTKVYSKMLV